jgi:uracil-DNA glycosylase
MDNKPKLEESWLSALSSEFSKSYFVDLKSFLVAERQQYIIYPKGNEIFAALNATPLPQIKVVIIGQDPYHGPGQAHGLCFSVNDGVRLPPSLMNIFKELHADVGCVIPQSGNLLGWAKQGVLLLNATLTVRDGQAGSHQKKGWENFTDRIIAEVNEQCAGVVFLLWGNFAKQKAAKINRQKHFVLEAAHPSPLSAYNGFFGCKHFSATNKYLIQNGKKPINWQL